MKMEGVTDKKQVSDLNSQTLELVRSYDSGGQAGKIY